MNYKELIKVAKEGNDINLSIEKFSEMDNIEKILKPYGYGNVFNISTFIGNKPNCSFRKQNIVTNIN